MTEKAVILARGLGTRMQRDADVELDQEHLRAARRGHKVLMPLHGRPFLDYVVDSLLRAGLRHVCFVVAPDADVMREQAERIGSASGATVECTVQEEPLGTADAVLAAEEFADGRPFVLSNGDNLYPDGALRELAGAEDDICRAVAFERDALVQNGNLSAGRVRSFAVMTVAEDGRLLGIVEKPEDPDSYVRDGHLWVNMNLYRFTPAVFDACRAIEPDPERGELELTSAVGKLIQWDEVEVRAVFSRGGVLDLTARADIATVERALEGRELSF
jgi:glucose-1-phosphate thymidylyltransferase